MKLRHAICALALSLVAFGVTLLPGPWLPRFLFDPLNYWFTGLSAIAIPASLLAVGVSSSSAWYKIGSLSLAVLSALPLVPFGLIAIDEATNTMNGEYLSHLKLGELSTSQGMYRLYRTDCGATCAYGLELRREIEIVGTVKLVSPIWSAYREENAELRLSTSGQVEVIRGAYVLHTVAE